MKTIASVALATFPLWLNGLTLTEVSKGDKIDVPEDLFAGLVDAKLIKADGKSAPAPVIAAVATE
jgi:hypothetical protein